MKKPFEYKNGPLYCHHSIDKAPRPEDFPLHAHEGMEIYYFLSGSGRYLIEGNAYDLRPGDLFLMRPAETHRMILQGSAPYERIALHFPPDFVARADASGQLLRPFFNRPLGQGNHYHVSEDPRLEAAFSAFSMEGLAHPELHMLGRLLTLLSVIAGIWERRKPQAPPCAAAHLQLLAYVNDHLFETLSLETVSAALYRSPSQISRIFRQATGASLWEYVTAKRLLAARALLQRGILASQVALECGFTDYSTFYRAYRSFFRTSPSQDKG